MVIVAVWNHAALIHDTWGLICLQVHLAFKSALFTLFTTWNRVKWTRFYSKLKGVQLWSLVQPAREKQPASCKLLIFTQALPLIHVRLLLCAFWQELITNSSKLLVPKEQQSDRGGTMTQNVGRNLNQTVTKGCDHLHRSCNGNSFWLDCPSWHTASEDGLKEEEK